MNEPREEQNATVQRSDACDCYAAALEDFADECCHLWDDERVEQVTEAATLLRAVKPLVELRDAVVGGETPGDTLKRLSTLLTGVSVRSNNGSVTDWRDWLEDFGNRLNSA